MQYEVIFRFTIFTEFETLWQPNSLRILSWIPSFYPLLFYN